MNPQRFAGVNCVMRATAGMENCTDVHSYKGQGVVITAWKPTAEELVKLNLGEFVWLTVKGEAMPPVNVSVIDPWNSEREG